jgi:hypothetical protein
MSDAGADMQAMLQAALEHEAACYEAALQPAAELAAACGRGEPIDDRLQQVLAHLGAIAEHEFHIAAVKRQWQEAGRPAGPALRAVLDRIAALIRQLSREMQVIEEAVRARRDQLAAELDGCNRRCQMQRAYLRKS